MLAHKTKRPVSAMNILQKADKSVYKLLLLRTTDENSTVFDVTVA